MRQSKEAFTMTELVFVIVVIGILAAVAVPKLAATRDDAIITKARTMVATVRNALAMERQKRILRGEFAQISAVGDSTNVFSNFYIESDGNRVDTGNPVLEYPLKSEVGKKDRWFFSAGTGKDGRDQYVFNASLNKVEFEVVNGKFECDSSKTNNGNSKGCEQLTN